YEINMLRCIFCGLCEEACPKAAIFLQPDKMAPVFTNRDEVIFGKDRLVEKMDDRSSTGIEKYVTEAEMTNALR
ncbi:MAG: 4Fe-4S binding protein, partial [Verrucomicrobia bacterium]|nr:4Fe-4S binding protein [Cytophagales bacterium]